MRKRLMSLAKVAISLGLLAWLLSSIGLAATLDRLKAADPGWLALAVVMFALGVALRAYRWQGLLAALGAEVGLGRLCKLYLVGFFFSKLLPGGLGGDVIRGVEAAQDGAGGTKAAGTVIVDRLAGLLLLFALSLLALPFSVNLVGIELALWLGVIPLAGVVGGWLLFQERWARVAAGFWPRRWRFPWQEKLVGVHQAIVACRGRPLGRALLVSLGVSFSVIGLNYTAALAMGIQVSPGYFFLFVPLISLSLLVPISWGGLGLREAVTILLFSQAGVEQPQALAMSLTVYLVNLLFSLLGGGVYLWMGLSGLRSGED